MYFVDREKIEATLVFLMNMFACLLSIQAGTQK